MSYRLVRGCRPKLNSAASIPCLRTRKFVAWGSTPRPGSRAASVTLGHPNKAFGSARIARCPRARELVAQRGGLSAAGRATRGPRLDDRSVHDSPQIRIKTAPSGLESISGCRVPRCVAQNGAPPSRHRTLLREVRWRPPKWGSRVPATLAPDGGAPRTRESHPSAAGTLGTRAVRPCAGWWLVTTPLLEATRPTSARRSGRAT